MKYYNSKKPSEIFSFLVLIVVISLLFHLGSHISANAQPSQNEKPLTWTVIFITTWNECSERNIKALGYYSNLVMDYLHLYSVDAILTQLPQCVSADNMAGVVEQTRSNNDLVIIISDVFQSLKQQGNTGTAGHYVWKGDSGVILSQAFSPKIESEFGAWVLSHELSHFALDWKGYPHEVYVDSVHVIQAAYDSCKNDDVSISMCTELWTSWKSPSGKSIPVMKPIATKNYVESEPKVVDPVVRQYEVPPILKPELATPPILLEKSSPQTEKSDLQKRFEECQIMECLGDKYRARLTLEFVDHKMEQNSKVDLGRNICFKSMLVNSAINGIDYRPLSGETVKIQKIDFDRQGNQMPNNEDSVRYLNTNSFGEISNICYKMTSDNPNYSSSHFRAYFDETYDYTKASSFKLAVSIEQKPKAMVFSDMLEPEQISVESQINQKTTEEESPVPTESTEGKHFFCFLWWCF